MFETGRSASQRASVARDLLESVGIGHRLTHLPSQLSVGERQRVSIARALANGPSVLLADEPTGNLDSRSGHGVMELFHRLHREQQMTLVMVTHDRVVAQHAQRLISIRDGRVVADERQRTPAFTAGVEI
jgi:putative ABC transport system ATP-binding protein